jgi:hypothetical protein
LSDGLFVRLSVLAMAALLCAAGCTQSRGASGKWATRLAPAPKGVKLSPPPPADFYWIRARAATIPSRTMGGKLWDEVGGWPDPLVAIYINDREVLRSPTVANELKPVWNDPGGNFTIGGKSVIRVELLDADTVRNKPMGSASHGPPSRDDLTQGHMRFEVFKRAEVVIEVAPAHALFGLGFDYGVFATGVLVHEIYQHSPAGRGGMRAGDAIVSIAGKSTEGMKKGQVKSLFNAVPSKGIEVIVRHKAGTTETMLLLEGPIYPTFQEYGPID